MTKICKSILLIAMALCFCLTMTFAEVTAPDIDVPEGTMEDIMEAANSQAVIGNLFASGVTSGETVEMDLYSVGETVSVENCKIGAAALLAARDISLNATEIGGSLRAAGYKLNVNDTAVANNITVAGFSIDLSGSTSAKCIFAAANDVTFGGDCYVLTATANKVVISGVVNGDAIIYASDVTVTDTAVINGTLRVKAANEPNIASGAVVGAVDFQQVVHENETETTVHTISFGTKLVGGLIALGGNLVLAVLYYFVIRRTTREAGDMITGRPVAMPITGLVSFIAVPLAILLLFITVIGIPAALLMMFCYGLILAFSLSFMGCAAGQRIFPKLHPLVASIIGVAALTILQFIPIVGIIVTIGAMLYALGFFIQKIYLNFGKKKPEAAPEIAQQ